MIPNEQAAVGAAVSSVQAACRLAQEKGSSRAVQLPLRTQARRTECGRRQKANAHFYNFVSKNILPTRSTPSSARRLPVGSGISHFLHVHISRDYR
jgi:hypothetical protein